MDKSKVYQSIIKNQKLKVFEILNKNRKANKKLKPLNTPTKLKKSENSS